MSRKFCIALLLAVVLGTVGLVLATSTASAARPPSVLPITMPEVGTLPDLSAFADTDVIDAMEYRDVNAFTRRVTPYVEVGADGLPRLGDVTAAQLGVDPAFLENFRQALVFAHEAIESGHVRVNADLTVERTGPEPADELPTGGPGALPGMPGAAETVPLWDAWHYPQGAMFYNSYPDYWQYYYNNYYVLCGALAARLGYPWMSTNLVYFYAYNRSYFQNHCYQNFGTYYYMPYSTSSCQQYNPCYCCGLSYRPVYFWVRTYVYSYSCGCYQYNWNWQGYWSRY